MFHAENNFFDKFIAGSTRRYVEEISSEMYDLVVHGINFFKKIFLSHTTKILIYLSFDRKNFDPWKVWFSDRIRIVVPNSIIGQ